MLSIFHLNDGHKIAAVACKQLCHVIHARQDGCLGPSEWGYVHVLRVRLRVCRNVLAYGKMSEVDPAVLEVPVREYAAFLQDFPFMPSD